MGLWCSRLKMRHEIKPFPVEYATLLVSSRNLLHGIVAARSLPFSFSGLTLEASAASSSSVRATCPGCRFRKWSMQLSNFQEAALKQEHLRVQTVGGVKCVSVTL